MIGIYKITSPSGRHYIGQSVDIKRRWTQHKNEKRMDKQPALKNSFKKYGINAHVFEIIEILTEKLTNDKIIKWLDSKELYYSIQFNSLVPDGLNHRIGKGRGYMSKEAIERNRITHIGPKNANYGRKFSEEFKRKIRERPGYWRGKKMPISAREKMILRRMGSHTKKAKPVDQITIDGDFVRTHRSIAEATKYIGAGLWDISNCLHGRQKTCRGYFWKFHNQKQTA